MEIEDNGIGLDDRNFKRLCCFKDDSKGFNNRGSGRIQFLHFFVEAYFMSIYKDEDSFCRREVEMSKKVEFLTRNAVIYSEPPIPSETEECCTRIILSNLRDEKDKKIYNEINLGVIKSDILNKYMLLLCSMQKKPIIRFKTFIQDQLGDNEAITSADIPLPAREDFTFIIHKSKISTDLKRIENTDEEVAINATPYVLSEDSLEQNLIKITCKGEIIEKPRVKTTFIGDDYSIDDKRYLILLHSNYFDCISTDQRGSLPILSKREFKKQAKSVGFISEQVLLEDIQESANEKVKETFQEIADESEKRKEMIDKLKKDYLITDEALEDIKDNDGIKDILFKAYTYDAKYQAEIDAAYNESVNKLETLDTTQPNYQEELGSVVDELIKDTPIKNRTALSRYVARRSMIIELLGKILDERLKIQQEGQNYDEKILHNLIFSQHSDNPSESDLWLLSEEYMYFKGFSEHRLNEIKINGYQLFKDVITEEEDKYLNSVGHNRLMRRPDILLFPDEGKCIIIELKNPEVELSLHLNQINKYAYFLRNFTNDEFVIDTFYGYLIGDTLIPRDVRAADSDFINAPKLNFMYRPNKLIADDSGHNHDGNLYTEILTFKVIKERAEIRNKAFKEKLFGKQEVHQREQEN